MPINDSRPTWTAALARCVQIEAEGLRSAILALNGAPVYPPGPELLESALRFAVVGGLYEARHALDLVRLAAPADEHARLEAAEALVLRMEVPDEIRARG